MLDMGKCVYEVEFHRPDEKEMSILLGVMAEVL